MGLVVFPLAHGINTFAATGLLVALGLLGRGELAAEIGLGQAAVLLVFLAFSGNARCMALAGSDVISPALLVRSRLVLLTPLSLIAWALCAAAGVPALVALALILRRCGEWIGELDLSQRELRQDARGATRFLLLQGVLWTMAAALLATQHSLAETALCAWALAPILLSLRFVRSALRAAPSIAFEWVRLLPHFGSTAIVALAVFVFRSLLVLMTPRSMAGELFTAFALGGLWPAVFAAGIGPTLHLLEGSGRGRRLRWAIWLVTALWALAGAVTLVLVRCGGSPLLAVHPSVLFWQAVGCSLLGGSVMTVAQRLRIELLQKYSADLFGPDVLSNLLVVVSVPAACYVAGRESLPLLYLWNAVLVLGFSASAWCAIRECRWFARISGMATVLVPVLLLCPVFLQPGGGIFHHAGLLYDSQGQLHRLPIPLAVPACYLGLLLLAGYRSSYRTLAFIFFAAALLLLTPLLAGTSDPELLRPKMLLAIQTILPLPALVLGEMYAANERARRWLHHGMLATVAVIVPAQLVASWARGFPILHSDLEVFSIYQHLQYVPVILVSLYLVALFSRFGAGRETWLLVLLAPAVGVYAAASTSMLALGMAPAGSLIFLWYFRRSHVRTLAALTAALLLTGATSYFMWGLMRSSQYREKYAFALQMIGAQELLPRDLGPSEAQAALTLPRNLADRLECWEHYAGRTFSNAAVLWTGHNQPPPRNQFPSAHSFYLDLAYNFGLPSAGLFLLLAIYGLWLAARHRVQIRDSADLFGLAIVVAFLVLADNSLKVGFRQPYPGIVSFLLWGLLLGRLHGLQQPACALSLRRELACSGESTEEFRASLAAAA
ncbi:MAG: hypothetical protein KY476_22170 [Planctomycetes bacterium]|nr:hypothetical protein [Planctomycetota bacterium]